MLFRPPYSYKSLIHNCSCKGGLKSLTYSWLERGGHNRNLLNQGVGFREEEEFLKKERGKLKGGRAFDVKKETVRLAMKEKLKDDYKYLRHLRRLRTRIIRRMEATLGQ